MFFTPDALLFSIRLSLALRPRHEAVAIEVWLLIRVLGFILFELFANLYCKTVRHGGQTMKDLRDELFIDLGNWQELAPLWSG